VQYSNLTSGGPSFFQTNVKYIHIVIVQNLHYISAENDARQIPQLARHLKLLSMWLSFCMFVSHRNTTLDLSLIAHSVLPSCSQPKPVQLLSNIRTHHPVIIIIIITTIITEFLVRLLHKEHRCVTES